MQAEYLSRCFWGHHLAILGTFSKSLDVSCDVISIKTNGIPDSNWNYFSPLRNGNKNKQKDYIIKQIDSDRLASIYLPSYLQNGLVINKTGYSFKVEYSDAWMQFDLNAHNAKNYKYIIKEVSSVEEMKLYISIFSKSFSGSSEHEPYGNLPIEYQSALMSSFMLSRTMLKHYIAYDVEMNPCGCGSLVVLPPFAYFYCLGVLPKSRGMGIAAELINYRIMKARKYKCSTAVLQTEKNTLNERMFTKLGFKNAFSADCICVQNNF